jgi:hypothetical protein
MLAAPVGDDVDRRSPPGAGPQGNLLDQIRLGRPFGTRGTGWQYSALVRGQVPLVRKTNPPEIGTSIR